jgi:hypothetical protein
LRVIVCLAVALLSSGCATLSSVDLPPLDTSAPGWTVRQGQALWRTESDKPEVAGDVVLSSHQQAGSFVQFSKTLPILSARIAPEGWEFEAVPENKRYSGRGKPPRRIAWLQLLRVLEGAEISDHWTVAKPSTDYVLLENQHSGERLELRLQ